MRAQGKLLHSSIQIVRVSSISHLLVLMLLTLWLGCVMKRAEEESISLIKTICIAISNSHSQSILQNLQ